MGWILVALGVAGEGIAEYFVNDAETNLRAFDQTVLAETQRSANSAAAAASLANTFADKANTAAGKALDTSKVANEQARIAKERAEDVGEQADELQRDNAKLAGKLEASEKEALAERKKEDELQKSLAPRKLPVQLGPGGFSTFGELKPFAGVKVIFEVLTDAEARRAAEELGNVVRYANWDIVSTTPNPDLYLGFFDGVVIWYERFPSSFPRSPAEKSNLDAAERCEHAARALEAFLVSENWKARPLMHITRNPDHP